MKINFSSFNCCFTSTPDFILKLGQNSNFEMPLPVTLIMFQSDDRYWKLKTIVSWTVYMTAIYDQFNSKTCCFKAVLGSILADFDAYFRII